MRTEVFPSEGVQLGLTNEWAMGYSRSRAEKRAFVFALMASQRKHEEKKLSEKLKHSP